MFDFNDPYSDPNDPNDPYARFNPDIDPNAPPISSPRDIETPTPPDDNNPPPPQPPGPQQPPSNGTGMANIPLGGAHPPQALVDVLYPGYKIQGDSLVWQGDGPASYAVSNPQLAGQYLKSLADPLEQKNYQRFFETVRAGYNANSDDWLTKDTFTNILKAGGFNITPPNAAGERTKIQTPSGEWVRVLNGPKGKYDWTWVPQGANTGNTGTPNGLIEGGLLDPFNEPFNGLDPSGRPTLPDYEPPGLPDLPDFVPPDAQSVLSKPGYDFRRKQGEDSITNNASMAGLLRTGGTLKDFINYNQNFASNEYQNEFDRELQGYDRSIANRLATSDRQQTQALAKYDPLKIRYQTGTSNFNNDYDRLWREYLNRADTFYKNQGNVFDRLKWQSEFGLNAAKAA